MRPSWHIPRLKHWDQPSPNDVLHVVFLQRLPKNTSQQIVESLANANADWASTFDPSGIMSKPRQLRTIPWIRDSSADPKTILEILSVEREKYQSYILIDSLWNASTVIAAHWTTDGGGVPKLDAVRVSMSIANVLLTLIDNGQVSGFAQVLGEAMCAENKIDFSTDGPLQSWESNEPPSFEQAPFLPSNSKLDKSKLEILSLRELSHEQKEALKGEILKQSDEVRPAPSIEVHNWQGPSPSRNELRQIYDRMNGNSAAGDRNSIAWFVDNIIEGDDRSLQIIALASDAQPTGSQDVSQAEVSLFPLQHDCVLPLFNDCNTSDAYCEKAYERCHLPGREVVVAPRGPVDFGSGSGSLCPVFYLCPFNTDQERAIRVALNSEEGASVYSKGTDFAYYGYLFPSESGTYMIEDLFDLFQKCDPFSPSFDPLFSNMRFKNYPEIFVAVDLKCLDADNPKVGMADVEHSQFEPSPNGATHCTGWRYGTTRPGRAWKSYFQLFVANASSFELFDHDQMMYLHDMKKHEEDERLDLYKISNHWEIVNKMKLTTLG